MFWLKTFDVQLNTCYLVMTVTWLILQPLMAWVNADAPLIMETYAAVVIIIQCVGYLATMTHHDGAEMVTEIAYHST